MTQPTVPVMSNSLASELGTTFGTHLDQNFATIVASCRQIIANLALIQRDDGQLSNQSVHANAFTSDALALMAGSSVSSTVQWLPRGAWATATLYNVGNIVETGSPKTAYVCAVKHTSAAAFATDYAAGDWVVLSTPRTLVAADVTTALTYTPVNLAGDTMQGALTLVTGSKIGGSSGATFTDTLLATQDLLTADKGLYSVYSSSKADIVYGFASNVVRTGGSALTVGGQFTGYGTSGAGASVFGANTNAIGFSGFAQALIGHEIDIGSYDPNNTAAKIGLNVIFFNRASTNPGQYSYAFPQGTYSSAGGGLGSNYYNRASIGVWLQSQARSSTGEFCGWNTGIQFDEYSLDYSNEGDALPRPPRGIDFSKIHYYGGVDPTTAYRMDAAIALRDLQTIWWNRDPASPLAVNKVRTFFNPFSSRWVIANGGSEMFGVDVTNGQIYIQNTLFSTGPSLTGNNTWSGTNTFNAAVTLGTSLAFTGNARRITGDFSNATVANRVIVQTSTANAASELGVIPNGTSTTSALYLHSDALAANGVVGRIAMDPANFAISSTAVGTGVVAPMVFNVGATEVMRANTAGTLCVGTAVGFVGAKLHVGGIVAIDNPVAFMVNNNAVAQNVASATTTQLAFSTKEYDTNTNFSTGTGRFTPTLGKYVLMGSAQTTSSVDQGLFVVMVYKNGVQHKNGVMTNASGTGAIGSTVSCIVDANGTDYFDLRVYQSNSTVTTLAVSGATTDCWFGGFRVG